MRIYTRSGDLAFKTFTFPDGQPHFKLETYEREFQSVTIEMALRSPADLFQILLVSDVLRQHGYSEISLDIRYLMGARMDRAISVSEPFTLRSVARLINSGGFNKVRILDVHSQVAMSLIRNSENVLPVTIVEQVIAQFPSAAIVIPDKGAVDRVMKISRGPSGYIRDVVRCGKRRDPQTGQLSGFEILDGGYRVTSEYSLIKDRSLLIIDDICDGGGTFVGLAKELRKAGAKKVYLYITHGVFSKGVPLEGIDHIYTTNSYLDIHQAIDDYTTLTVIPVSMEKL